MHDGPFAFHGQQLTLDEYLDHSDDYFWKASKSGHWRLERLQSFVELEDRSWEALVRGDWTRSMELLTQDIPQIREQEERIARNGGFRRVRVVREPFTPYLIWELNALRIRHEYGSSIHVVDMEVVAPLEANGNLPEILILCDEVVYQVLYDKRSKADGAIVSTDRTIIGNWAELIENLYNKGEDLEGYFERKIAGLTPSNAG
jgi:hypothetical protein